MLSSGIGAGAVTTWCMLHGQSPGEAAVITVMSTITALVSVGPASQVTVSCVEQLPGARQVFAQLITPQLPALASYVPSDDAMAHNLK